MGVTSSVTLEKIAENAQSHGLLVMGALNNALDAPAGTTVLLGTGPAFWPAFTRAPEYSDDLRDPIDRWSKRVLKTIADPLGATASFPSDGPPYPPFISWALATGRFFQSPVGMMVHDTVGLMISLRGALHLPFEISLTAPSSTSPCEACPAPCTTGCPVSALNASKAYDLKACHTFLDSPDGTDCMSRGCIARRACPLSVGAHRPDAQSALHMKAFHP